MFYNTIDNKAPAKKWREGDMHHHHHWKAIKYSCFINSFNSQKWNFSAVSSVLVAIMCFLLAPSNVIFNVLSSKWCTKPTQSLSCSLFYSRLFSETHKFNSDHKNSCHIRNRNITKRRAKKLIIFFELENV